MNTERTQIESVKGALRPSLAQIPINNHILVTALKELSEEFSKTTMEKAYERTSTTKDIE